MVRVPRGEEMVDNLIPLLTNNGASMPSLGYGTMKYPEPDRASDLIAYSLKSGYRHIDTARKYGSEEWVGQGIRASGVLRDDIWVTTKVTEDNASADDFARSVELSLNTMKLDYVNLLLIHWPSRTVSLEETLGALVKAKRDGYAKNIGVSNFTVDLIEKAVNICSEPLFTNQIEYHAYINQDKVINACHKHNIIISCHVPLCRGKILDDPLLNKIGQSYGKSAAQVGLRWLVQQKNIAIVPRALEYFEIEENMNIFDFKLTDSEMDHISNLRSHNHRIVDPEVRRPVWD